MGIEYTIFKILYFLLFDDCSRSPCHCFVSLTNFHHTLDDTDSVFDAIDEILMIYINTNIFFREKILIYGFFVIFFLVYELYDNVSSLFIFNKDIFLIKASFWRMLTIEGEAVILLFIIDFYSGRWGSAGLEGRNRGKI